MTETAIELVEKQTIVDELCDILYTRYNKPRVGNFIHISEINLCRRLSVFRRIDPKDINWRQFNYFIFGESCHFICQELAQANPKYTIEKEVKYKDIIMGHMDLFDEKEKVVYEIKTVRKAKLDKVKPHQVEQLKMYMALSGAKKGVLWHMLLLNYDSNPFALVEYTMTEKERQDLLREMELKAENLKMSIDLKDPSTAEDIMVNKSLNWLCDYCPYTTKCVKMPHTGDKTQ